MLVTAARNEEAFIGRTLASVIAQTAPPVRWVIVDDGSTDMTAEVVARHKAAAAFITVLKLSRGGERGFARKVQALKAGEELLKGIAYDLIGFLDADVSFGSGYFERLCREFADDSALGLTGGMLVDLYDGRFHPRVHYRASVSGAVQLFRRSAYEGIGGYRPIETGGIDTVAEVMVRMHAWQTRTLPDLAVVHHRRDGSVDRGPIEARYRSGFRDSMLGHDPIFQLFKCLRRCTERPWLLSSVARLVGYLAGNLVLLTRRRAVPPEFVDHLRREQRQRLAIAINGLVGRRVATAFRSRWSQPPPA